MDICEGREVSHLHEFIRHVSSVRLVDGIVFSVRCHISLWSEIRIYLMASDLLWQIFTIDITAKRTVGAKVFGYCEVGGSISLAIRGDNIYFSVWSDMFAWISIAEYP